MPAIFLFSNIFFFLLFFPRNQKLFLRTRKCPLREQKFAHICMSLWFHDCFILQFKKKKKKKKVIWGLIPIVQATPKSDHFVVLFCCTEVELVDLGYGEMEKEN